MSVSVIFLGKYEGVVGRMYQPHKLFICEFDLWSKVNNNKSKV